MPTWNGSLSTDFLAATNWVGGTAPSTNSVVTINNTGSGLSLGPTLSAGQSATIFSLEQSARTFLIQGALSISDAATLSGAALMTIEATGTVNTSGGMFVERGAASELRNNGTLNSTLQVSSGLVDNRGVITGPVTISGGIINLNAGSNISNNATLTVNGGAVNVFASENVGLLAGTGGEVAISATRVLTVGGAGNSSFSGVISGAGSLTKDGLGTLTLTGSNTFSGTTAISAGTLQVGAIGLSGSLGTGAVVNNGALVFNLGTFHFIDNVISGTGSLTINGWGTTVLRATNTYSGTTTINELGVLIVSAYNNSGTLGTGNVINHGQLQFAGDNAVTLDNVISGNGGVSFTGFGTFTLSATNTHIGRLDVAQDAELNIEGSIDSQNIVVGGGLRVDGASLSNTATVTLNHTGNLTLTGSETIGALIPTSATTSVTLAGNKLTLTAQTAGLGTMTINGSLGGDRLAITLDQTLANFTLSGVNFTNWTQSTDLVTVIGNALANRLTGNSRNNVLNGGLGNDTMLGGAGNDTYLVNAALDRVFETTTTASTIDAGGVDTVQSRVNFSLDAYAGVRFVENLTLTGTANINGSGNALANRLMGNSGNNVLNGGLGNDTMLGGAGNDTFVFNTALGPSNLDHTTDFNVVQDTIRLENLIFTGLSAGTLAAHAFTSNTTGLASDTADRIIYETDTGRLYFDANGSGAGARVLFATLNANLALTNADFIVV